MATMQIKNMPDALHKELSKEAKLQGTTMSRLALDAIARHLAKRHFSARLASRPLTHLDESSVTLLHDARAERDEDSRG